MEFSVDILIISPFYQLRPFKQRWVLHKFYNFRHVNQWTFQFSTSYMQQMWRHHTLKWLVVFSSSFTCSEPWMFRLVVSLLILSLWPGHVEYWLGLVHMWLSYKSLPMSSIKPHSPNLWSRYSAILCNLMWSRSEFSTKGAMLDWNWHYLRNSNKSPTRCNNFNNYKYWVF